MTTTPFTFNVPSMSCGHCVSAITAELKEVSGVAMVAIDLDTKAVVVTGENLSEDALRAAIEEAGYEATS
jgi:copper chaperone